MAVDEDHKGIVSSTLPSTGAKLVSLLIIQFNGLGGEQIMLPLVSLVQCS